MEMIISQLKSPQEWYQVCRRAAGYGLTNKGDFLNLQQQASYWYGTESYTGNAWAFGTSSGYIGIFQS